MKPVATIALAICGAGAALYGPVLAQGTSLAMLDHLERGHWQLRTRGAGGAVESLCLDNGRRFIQLRHPSEQCSSVIVDDTRTEVTVQYTCPGRGYGRTHIRWESNRLAQIESQGIVRGAPFAFSAEARRVGDCQE